jgi:AraC-like DNA-binding protein
MIDLYPELVSHPEDYFYSFLKLYGVKLEENSVKAVYSNENYKGQLRLFRLAHQNTVVFIQNFFYNEVRYNIRRMLENTWGQLHIVFVENVGYVFSFTIIRNSHKTEDVDVGFTLRKDRDKHTWISRPNVYVQFLAIYLSIDYLKEIWGYTDEDPLLSNNQTLPPENEQLFVTIRDPQSIQILDKIFDKSALSNTGSPIKEYWEDAIQRVLGAHVFFHSNSKNGLLTNLKNAEEALLKDFENIPSLTELSKIAGMNRVKFQKLFTEHYGCTFYQYYQQKRFEYAKKLIERMDYTASDAAYAIGYKHLGHFSREFAKVNGIKPSELKKHKQ